MIRKKKNNKENKVEEPIAGYGTGYTYADYLKFEFDEMVELIKGKIFKMSPAPKSYHQQIVGNLHATIHNFLKHQSCAVFAAPFDVVLPIEHQSKNNSKTVVQPDICIICDLSKIDDAGCFGAPDFIAEIISDSTSNKDMIDKYEVYQEAGVREYWIVFPKDEVINCYVLQNGEYTLHNTYNKSNVTSLHIIPDLTINVDEVFHIKR